MHFLRLFIAVFLLPAMVLGQVNTVGGYQANDILRAKLHDDINSLQKGLPSNCITKTYSLQKKVEENAVLDHRLKVKYLTGVKYVLEDLTSAKVSYSNALSFLNAYEVLMDADLKNMSIEALVYKNSYEINQSLLNERTVFYENSGLQKARVYLYYQFIKKTPDQTLKTISNYLNEQFVDELLTIAAYNNPNEFYDYASAIQTPLSQRMLRVKDKMVQLLCKLSSDSSGRLLFPFLDPLLSNEIEYDSLKRISNDEKKFFQLLVQTQIQFQSKKESGITPYVDQEIFKLLKKKATDFFINSINGMHDEPDLIRFKILDGLAPEELYYLMISTEDVIYTSSFVGVFQRMMNNLNNRSTDQLFNAVHFDGFKKFIKMAADYNKLDAFINAMQPGQANLILKYFVSKLESDATMEDAVDVANAFSSIANPGVKKIIVNEINENLQTQKAENNDFGIKIYEALQLLLMAENDSGKAFAATYQINAPYFIPADKLFKDGRMIEQLFFYGDKDGIRSFQNFQSYYRRNKAWRIVSNPNWIEIKSLIGKPISIFANIPFDHSNGDDPDAKAQEALSNYLKENESNPTIVVHRGHSYHLPSTLEQLKSSAKVVLLGSCGSYQHLSAVLDACPDAQIISSREVGSLSVNDPILNIINESIRRGENIDWVSIWKKLNVRLGNGGTKERFENYVAPHKNLGALLLRAFGKKQ